MVLHRMQRAWSWYQRQLVNKPVRTQIVTSALLWASGDAVAQRVDREMWQSRHRREARMLQEGPSTPTTATILPPEQVRSLPWLRPLNGHTTRMRP